MNLSPITIFCYNRLDNLKSTIFALQNNHLATESDLIVFSDGPKNENDKIAVNQVRAFLNTITGFKTITIHLSAENKGLANSIIQGVSNVFDKYDSIIVLEDDLVTSNNFLDYMNDALRFYKDYNTVFSIAGYSIPIKNNSKCDVYFTGRSFSWGWATWKSRWDLIDWEVKDFDFFKTNNQLRKEFNKMGSDMSRMLDRQMNHKINSWAIRWCYHQFKFNLFSVHPFASKISNIGFNSKDASNTKVKFNPFKTKLDASNKTNFSFSEEIKFDKSLINQFTKPFSVLSRVKYKFLNFFYVA
jgi:hypothetical protein